MIIRILFFIVALSSLVYANITNDFDFSLVGYRNQDVSRFVYSNRSDTVFFVTSTNGWKPIKPYYKSITFNTTSTNILTKSDWLGTNTGTFYLIIKIRGNGGANFGQIISNGKCQIRINSTGGTKVAFSNNSSATESQTSVLELNRVYILVFVRNAAGTVDIYIDGALYSSGIACGAIANGFNSVIIGNNSNYNRGFDGDIYEVKFTENLHSETQIRHNANELIKMYQAENR